MKIDLHVHSKYSTRPSQWVLQKLGCQECYTEPLAIYRIAKEKGMTAVTITDHNTIQGILEICHLPDTFISEEVTTYFPDGCKVHVPVYQIDERQHADIQKARTNIFDLVAYLNAEEITHTLAHPIWAVNNRLTLSHFEQLLLLFKNFELNGARDARLNDWLKIILSILSPADLDKMRETYKLTPPFPNPWEKNFTGGSDDHSSINIARMFTEVEMAANFSEYFQGLNQGRAEIRGQASTPLTLAYNIYSIAYQFYKSKYKLSDTHSYSNIFSQIFERILDSNFDQKAGFSTLYYIGNKIRNMVKCTPKDDSIISLITDEVAKISCTELNGGTENKWFEIINMVSVNILKQFNKSFRKALTGAQFIELVNSITSSGLVYMGLSPYFAAYTSFAGDRQLGQEIVDRFLEGKHSRVPQSDRIKLAHFTDTFYEINGVGLTLQRQVEAAVQANKKYTIITCDKAGQAHAKGVKSFAPIGVFHLPEYKEQKLFHPPVLEILNYCYKNNFTHIKAATPGPMGLTALAVARMLQLPIWGTYHTALPQYAQYLTDDGIMVDLMWKYIVWFYNQMDVVYVPSRSTAEELAAKGINPDKMKVYPRGVDVERFNPDKRNGFLQSRYHLAEGTKLLYVGRVSKEKDLEILGRAFRTLAQNHVDLHLVVVGDGPYLEEMRQDLVDTPCLFTGYLEGEDLAEVYASCDLFLFPSATDTFGNVVLEAQASGLPVIVTDSGGPRENVLPGQTGLIIPAHDEAALHQAVEKLIADPDHLKEMGRLARDYVRERSFDHAFQQSWELYEEKAAN
jgi:glycosyltransferase involved in cell wall biosynthesis